MASRRAVPTVTEKDLLDFHLATYGRPFRPLEAIVVESSREADRIEEEDEDGLGYYPDGTKRTLTDEQIAIFRHSEVHALLLKKRRAEEARKGSRSPVSEGEIRSDDEGGGAEQLPSRIDNAPANETISDGEIEDGEEQDNPVASITEEDPQSVLEKAEARGDEGEDGDSEAEYERFLEQERKDFEAEAKQRRQQRDDKGHRSADCFNDRLVSTRRKVREMDSFDTADQVLDYGDEGGSANAGISHEIDVGEVSSVAEEKAHGRKIWWPTIGA